MHIAKVPSVFDTVGCWQEWHSACKI